MLAFLFIPALVGSTAAGDLITISRTRSSSKQCNQVDVKTCYEAKLDVGQLENGMEIKVPEVTPMLPLLRRESTGKKGGRVAVFGKKEHEAVFTWNSVTGAVAGSLHSAGRAWTLEGSGEGRFVWIEYK